MLSFFTTVHDQITTYWCYFMWLGILGSTACLERNLTKSHYKQDQVVSRWAGMILDNSQEEEEIGIWINRCRLRQNGDAFPLIKLLLITCLWRGRPSLHKQHSHFSILSRGQLRLDAQARSSTEADRCIYFLFTTQLQYQHVKNPDLWQFVLICAVRGEISLFPYSWP